MSRRLAVVCRLFLALAVLAGCDGNAAAPLPAQIEAVFREAHEDGGFDGSVLVTRNGQSLYAGSFGLADIDRKTPNSANTRFLVYSITKPVTAILVFQQIEAGKLGLDDRLEKFFPNLSAKPAGGITLRQLLTHTSGIEELITRHPDRRITASDLEAAIVVNPGKFAYSNSGFVCLTLVLEAVTGQGYAELLDASILRPAGMQDSGTLKSGVAVAGLAVGYRVEGAHRVPSPIEVSPEAFVGAGSLYTTTGDLARFDQALNDGKLLPAKAQAQMISEQVKGRGFGWSLDEQGGKYFPWHQGAYRGYTAVLVLQVHRHEMIAILSNDQDTDLLGLRSKVLRLLKRSP